jgi:hypothetical protein
MNKGELRDALLASLMKQVELLEIINKRLSGPVKDSEEDDKVSVKPAFSSKNFAPSPS